MTGGKGSDFSAQALCEICHTIHPDGPWISPEDFLQASQSGQWVVVDVRPDRARAVSVIAGALGRDAFKSRAASLAGRPVMVYCTAGCQSATVVQDLRKSGIDARNLRGGVLGWALAGGGFVTPAGDPTRAVCLSGFPSKVLPAGYEATCE